MLFHLPLGSLYLPINLNFFLNKPSYPELHNQSDQVNIHIKHSKLIFFSHKPFKSLSSIVLAFLTTFPHFLHSNHKNLLCIFHVLHSLNNGNSTWISFPSMVLMPLLHYLQDFNLMSMSSKNQLEKPK